MIQKVVEYFRSMFSMNKMFVSFQQARRSALGDSGVPKEREQECLEWAFGIGFESKPIKITPSLWNERHSGLFIMYNTDSLIDSFRKIGKAFMESQ
jgi:hypothetical protein